MKRSLIASLAVLGMIAAPTVAATHTKPDTAKPAKHMKATKTAKNAKVKKATKPAKDTDQSN